MAVSSTSKAVVGRSDDNGDVADGAAYEVGNRNHTNAGAPSSSAATAPSSTKKYKGRLKKLMKKLGGVDATKDVSGLVDANEWVELQELWKHQSSSSKQHPERTSDATSTSTSAATATRRSSSMRWGPQIRRRVGSQQQVQHSTVDVADHRDLLFRLVGISGQHGSSSSSYGDGQDRTKKRRLDSPSGGNGTDTNQNDDDDDDLYTPKVPMFASVHNPALVERAAVVELHCSADQYAALVAGLGAAAAVTDEGNEKAEDVDPAAEDDGHSLGSSHCLGVSTRWFPGLHHPKTASHGMLYAAPKPKKVPKRAHPTAPTNLMELYNALVELSPSMSEMQSEGYPCRDPDLAGADTAVSSPPLLHLSNPSTAGEGLLPLVDVTTAHEMARRAAVTIRKNDSSSDHEILYVSTTDRHVDDNNTYRVCAIDCEMVETTLGRELARITLLELVEFDGSSASDPHTTTTLRLDQLVQPRGVVTDYLTQYSGITAQLLEAGPTVELVQVQATLLQFLSKNDVLIGHSLENDLHAIRLVHPTVLDTALLFRAHGAAYKHSLRHLASNLLHRTIQAGSHCSREDAHAALDLAVQRAYKGPNYARHLIRPRPANLLTRLSQRSTLVCVGPHDWLQEHVESRSTLHALTCDSLLHPNHKALAAWLTSSHPSRRARLAYGCWTLPRDTNCSSTNGSADGSSSSSTSDPAVKHALDLVGRLRSQLPSSAVVCVTVQAEFRNALRLTELRKARLNPKSTVRWTEDEEVEWARLVNVCRTGMVYWMTGVKEEGQESA